VSFERVRQRRVHALDEGAELGEIVPLGRAGA
jgi:hypothetical protein